MFSNRILSLTLLISGFLIQTSAADNDNSYSTCASCHGPEGKGNIQLNASVLAGLDENYIILQLQNFKQGIRGTHNKDVPGNQMSAIASQLSEQQIKKLAKSISEFESSNNQSPTEGNITQGKKYYVANCSACHSGTGAGNLQLHAPTLLVQSPEYLTRQINYFRSQVRGTHPSDKYGRQMAMMAKTLPDQQAVSDVIAYILSL